MPQGKGTYGSKVGRPPKKKKEVLAPTGNQRLKKRKKKPVNTPSAPAGYSKRTRMDMAAKEALSGGVAKKKKPVNTPSAPAGYSKRRRMNIAAIDALSGGVAKKKVVKKSVKKRKKI